MCKSSKCFADFKAYVSLKFSEHKWFNCYKHKITSQIRCKHHKLQQIGEGINYWQLGVCWRGHLGELRWFREMKCKSQALRAQGTAPEPGLKHSISKSCPAQGPGGAGAQQGAWKWAGAGPLCHLWGPPTLQSESKTGQTSADCSSPAPPADLRHWQTGDGSWSPSPRECPTASMCPVPLWHCRMTVVPLRSAQATAERALAGAAFQFLEMNTAQWGCQGWAWTKRSCESGNLHLLSSFSTNVSRL